MTAKNVLNTQISNSVEIHAHKVQNLKDNNVLQFVQEVDKDILMVNVYVQKAYTKLMETV
jgi:hypothetical protein